MQKCFGCRAVVEQKQASDHIRIKRRMGVCPQREMFAFKNRLKIQGKQWIAEHVTCDVQVLNIIDVESLMDERRMNPKR